ncbi:MAG TPA: Rieske 2Fe-2S domain-containing protein [Acidobacteriaceae bacterium]|jgi:UDP-MurNAc hydroxylase
MQITYLGHAGFVAETEDVIVIMDPWLSSTGAFDASWFQLPCNHHLATFVYEKLRDTRRSIFLYVSHEHQDHLDINFLNSLPVRRFSLLMPSFSRSALMSRFSNYECQGRIFFHHQQQIEIPGGFLKLYVDDSQLNRDSAILMNADGAAFLNLNDCKLFDALPEISREQGHIKVLACQFSGATWHPTCYDYPVERYEATSKKKYIAKFESVAKAIELVRPDVYIPSAGPVCFLDPMLLHLNSQRVNIFPRAAKIIDYLNRRLWRTPTFVPEMMPGDVLDATSGEILSLAERRFEETTAQTYITEYAASYGKYFEERHVSHSRVDSDQTFVVLRAELESKLEQLSLADRVTVPLYFRLSESAESMLRVDFGRKRVEYVAANNDTQYYEIVAPAWQVEKVLARELTWEEFSLTFRMRLKRDPDVYDPVLHAFLVMEAEDIGGYCDLLVQIEAQEQRVVVEAGGRQFSIRRYCPHQGGDLSCGWIERSRFLTCPRHRWQFDLFHDGQCTTNFTSIHAVPLESGSLIAQSPDPTESLASCPREAEVVHNGKHHSTQSNPVRP